MANHRHKAMSHEDEKIARKARRHLKRNTRRKRVRERDWARYAPGVYEELDMPTRERIMPRGERERRTAAMAVITEQLGGEAASVPSVADWQPGLVVRATSGRYQVNAAGHTVMCTVRGSLVAYDTGYTNVVAVGDWVLFSSLPEDMGVIEEVRPRRCCLSRADVYYPHLRQVIVANVDQLLIVSSIREPLVWFELVDRYLVAAAQQGLRPIVCLNKVDLAASDVECQRQMAPYVALGYEVLFTSATTGRGIEQLDAILRDRATAVAGLSGVGKSSLLNAVQPGLQLDTGHVGDRTHQGRHTTVEVSLESLEKGGYVVDTPGIREFGLWDLPREELWLYFPEIADRPSDCRLPRCTHVHEPGCSVKAAVQRGEIAASRYDSYVKIRG